MADSISESDFLPSLSVNTEFFHALRRFPNTIV